MAISEQNLKNLVADLKSVYTNSQLFNALPERTQTAIRTLFNQKSNLADTNISNAIYKGLALYYHPDKHPNKAKAEQLIKIILEIPQQTSILTKMSNIYFGVKEAKMPQKPDYKYQNHKDFGKQQQDAKHYNYQKYPQENNQSIYHDIRLTTNILNTQIITLNSYIKYGVPLGINVESNYQARKSYYNNLLRKIEKIQPPIQTNEMQYLLKELTAAFTKAENLYQQYQQYQQKHFNNTYQDSLLLNKIENLIIMLKAENNNFEFIIKHNLRFTNIESYQKTITIYNNLTKELSLLDKTLSTAIHKKLTELSLIAAQTKKLYAQINNTRKANDTEMLLRNKIDKAMQLLTIQKSALNYKLLYDYTTTNDDDYRQAIVYYNDLLRDVEQHKALPEDIKIKINALKNSFKETQSLYNQKNNKMKILLHINEISKMMDLIALDIQNNNFNEAYYTQALTTYEKLFAKLETINPNLKALYNSLHITDQIQQLKNRRVKITELVEQFKLKNSQSTNNQQFTNVQKQQSGWLNQEQIEIAKLYFAKYPALTKLSRKTKLTNGNGKLVQLPFSVMKSTDNKLYAIFHTPDKKGKQLLGSGTYGRVKLAQSLEDNTIIAAKIQHHYNDKKDYLQQAHIKQEEDIQQAVNQYLGHAKKYSTIKNQYSSKYTIQTKNYTFSKFIEGQNLTTHFKNNPTTIIDKLNIILKVLHATQALHNKGIIHGDLSFNNILYDAKTGNINIIDYGFAVKTTDPNKEMIFPDHAVDAPNSYFAPEYKQGRLSAKTDVYSLGYWISWIDPTKSNAYLQNLAYNMTTPHVPQRTSIKETIQQVENYLQQLNKPFYNTYRK